MSAIPTLKNRQLACRRPAGPPVMYQSWADLAFLHWEIDPALIESTLPPSVSVDTFEGRAYVGLVPFYMQNIRLRGLPKVPGTVNFLEMNVRTYVYDRSGTPGVWFYSLDANNPLACIVAQRRFHLPYYPAKISAPRHGDEIHYQCLPRRGTSEHRSTIHYSGTGNDVSGTPGTIEYFLAERYRLFAWQPKREQLLVGSVAHPPYRLETAKVSQCKAGAMKWCGFEIDDRPPDFAHFSSGLDVEVFALKSVEPDT